MSQQAQHGESSSFGKALIVCAIAGAAIVAGTLALGREPRVPERTTGGNSVAATEEYGQQLLTDTVQLLGPNAADPALRYSGNGLACASCHIGAGADPGNLSLATSVTRYPRKSPRSASNETIQDRINGCMMRSMNGRALPDDSPEMIAMVSYLRFLTARDAGMGKSKRKASESPAFKTPARRADLEAGERVFKQRCAACHQDDGQGLPASSNRRDGYVFPPLWGPDSFNDGAGMHRVLTAAKFIKARMPLGRADLTDDEAFDVAAFINSKPRPEMANLAADFPDKTAKPVDTGYPPFADSFPLDQHRFGPFGPIEAYYKAQKKSK
jgi:thiosulfate dehydrogenase